MTIGERPAEYIQYSEFGLYNMLDTQVSRCDHVRLQNLRLSYRLPKKAVEKLKVENVTVAGEARNLFVFGANYKNFLDPETMGNPFAQPIPRQFSFNLNVTF